MWQPVLMINGYLISVLGLAMLIPAFLDMYWTRAGWSHFLSSSIICLFIGLSLFLANRMNIKKITLQQGYLITVCGWVSLTLLGTLPFLLYGSIPHFADALFETMSGLSTTGATILPDVEIMPKAILLAVNSQQSRRFGNRYVCRGHAAVFGNRGNADLSAGKFGY